jgi:aerobic-type carbon monoxide dehydrogenase small subunit (CoxS/CutS family)
MAQISVNLNGKAMQCEVDESSLLSTFLREDCGLTGTHIGLIPASVVPMSCM